MLIKTWNVKSWSIILAPLLLVLLIWIPFGFSLTGLIEEWGVLGIFTKYGPIFIAGLKTPWASQALRPIANSPHALAYLLSPNSFDYWHILLIFSLILKGTTLSYLIWKITSSRGWGIFFGVLVLIYPADTMQLALRTLNISWALSLVLFASTLLVVSYQNMRPLIAKSLAVIASFLLFSAVCMYEAAAALILLPFMMLFVRDGFKTTLHQIRAYPWSILCWLTAISIYIFYALWVTPKIATYQSALTNGRGIFDILYTSLPNLFSIGVVRSLVGGWFDATRMVVTEFTYTGYLYITIITFIIFGFFIFEKKTEYIKKTPAIRKKINFSFRLGLMGFLLLCFGYIPYLFSPYHVVISQRTFLYATPGAAMVWLAVILLISAWRKWLAYFLVFILIFLGSGAQLYQLHHYVELSQIQRYLLKNILENFDGNLDNKKLVIFDHSNQLNKTWMFITENLNSALTYFYKKTIPPIEVCYMPSGEWQIHDPLVRNGKCIENKNDWTFRYPTPVSGPGYPLTIQQEEMTLLKEQMFAITINPDGSVTQNPSLKIHRNNLLIQNNATALRYRNILLTNHTLFNSNSFWAKHPERYKWSFGNWWSLDLPTKGNGWREAGWQVNLFYHQASAWKSQENSSLLFELTPIIKPYVLKGKFGSIISPKIHDSMQIRINQNNIPLSWITSNEFEAKVSLNILRSGINTIEFNSEVDPNYYGLSAELKEFEIKPE